MRRTDLIGLAAGSCCILLALAAGGNDGEAVWAQDQGPAQVDVSGYPPEAQEGYTVLVDRCGDCHTIARPLNTSMRAEYWAFYVGNLMKRHGVELSATDQRRLVKFLIHDQEKRKDLKPEAFFPPHAPNDSHGK